MTAYLGEKLCLVKNKIQLFNAFILTLLITLSPSIGQNIEDEPFVLLKEETTKGVGPVYEPSQRNFLLTVEFTPKNKDDGLRLLREIWDIKDKDLIKGTIEIYQNGILAETVDLTHRSPEMVLSSIHETLNLRFYFSLEPAIGVTTKTKLFIRESLAPKVNVRSSQGIFLSNF